MSAPRVPEGFPAPQVASDDGWEGVFAGEYRFAPGAETFWDEIEDNAEGESDPPGLGHSN